MKNAVDLLDKRGTVGSDDGSPGGVGGVRAGFSIVRGMPPADRHAHGTRARYVAAKCRCQPCRDANTEYAKARYVAKARGQFNGLVSTEPVRQHITMLREQGLGLRRIADKAGVARSITALVAAGRRTQLRNETARALLGVKGNMKANRLVPAGLAWMRIYYMLDDGVPQREIARRLGSRAAVPALQLRHSVITPDSHTKMRRIWEEHEANRLATEPDVAEVCTACGHSHTPAERQRLIARSVVNGVGPEHIAEAWPCFYDTGGQLLQHSSAYYRLLRDIAVIKKKRK